MQTEEKVKLWIWLSVTCGAGSPLISKLIDTFGGDVEKIYNATSEEYAVLAGANSSELMKLSNKNLERASQIYAYCKNEGVGIITIDSTLYPARLARILNRPAVLYYKGVLVDLDGEICISVIGTRSMTEYGARMAYSIAYDIAKAGGVVVSGMAKGIDGMAHRAALDAGGYTVAVLGCGVDRAYPSEHTKLMEEIIKRGLVISEFPPLSPPSRRNFPIRNRIISGISQGTLVVEAPSKSGALITAEEALKQGRDVFATPGKVGELNSFGVNKLIKKGAKIVTEAHDILLEYEKLYANKIDINKIPSVRSRKFFIPITQQYGKIEASPTADREKQAGIVSAVRRAEQEMSKIEAEEDKRRGIKVAEENSVQVGSSYAPNGSLGYLPENGKQPSDELYGFNTVRGKIENPSSQDIQSGIAFGNIKFGKGDDSPLPNPPFENPRGKISSVPKEPVAKCSFSLLAEKQKGVVEAYNGSTMLTADQLSVRTGYPVGDVLAALTMLEIDGWVVALPGGLYRLT